MKIHTLYLLRKNTIFDDTASSVNSLAYRVSTLENAGYITSSSLSGYATTSDISTLQSNFQDGCNTIASAVTAKGQTPASNSPSDIASAISNISGGELGVFCIRAYRRSTQNVNYFDSIIFSDQNGYITLSISGDNVEVSFRYKSTDQQITYENQGGVTVAMSSLPSTLAGYYNLCMPNCIFDVTETVAVAVSGYGNAIRPKFKAKYSAKKAFLINGYAVLGQRNGISWNKNDCIQLYSNQGVLNFANYDVYMTTVYSDSTVSIAAILDK